MFCEKGTVTFISPMEFQPTKATHLQNIGFTISKNVKFSEENEKKLKGK